MFLVKKSVRMPISSVSGAEATSIAGTKAAGVAGYMLINRIFTFLITGIAFILVARFLGSGQYGIYTLALAFAGIFNTLGYLAVGDTVNKFISEYKQTEKRKEINAVISNGMALVFVESVILVLLCVLFSKTLSQYVFQTPNYAYLIVFAALYILVSNFFGVFTNTFLGLGKARYLTIISIIEAFVQAMISIALAFEWSRTSMAPLAPILGLLIGYGVAIIAGIYFMHKNMGFSFVKPSMQYFKRILSFSLPIAAYNILNGLMSNVALIFTGYYVLASVIGDIGVASRAGILIGILIESINFALLPAFSSAFADKNLNKHLGRMYGYVVYLSFALAGPLLFYMVVFSAPFSHLIFGTTYVNAPLYISILSVGLLVGILGVFSTTVLVGIGEVKLAFKYNVLVNLGALLVVLIFVPVFGGIIYALSIFLIIPLLTDLLVIRKLSEMFKFRLKYNKLVRLVIADVIVSAVAVPLYVVSSGIVLLSLAAVVFVVFYPLAAALVGGVDRGDVDTIKTLSNEIPLGGFVLRFFMDYVDMVI